MKKPVYFIFLLKTKHQVIHKYIITKFTYLINVGHTLEDLPSLEHVTDDSKGFQANKDYFDKCQNHLKSRERLFKFESI
jgi:hypothetical protein